MPIQGQHLVAKTERQSTSNTRRDVVIQQPDGTSLYVMEILVTHAVEPDAWRCHNTANIPAGEAMAGWGNAAHNAARRSRQNVQPRPRINLPCRHGTRKNQLIDELSLKDQQLQQANTTIAELRGEIVQSKRNATRRHVQSKRGAIGLTKIGHGQPDHAPGNRPSEAGTEEYPRTSQPARQRPAGEMLPTTRHVVVAKTSNLDPTPTCRAGTEREKNQLINELFIKDQQLQQGDTIIAELQDRITQSKRNATRRHVQRNKAQAAL